jgi:hypothetical protein
MTSGIGHTAEDVGELCSDGPVVAKPYSHVELERRIRTLLAER